MSLEDTLKLVADIKSRQREEELNIWHAPSSPAMDGEVDPNLARCGKPLAAGIIRLAPPTKYGVIAHNAVTCGQCRVGYAMDLRWKRGSPGERVVCMFCGETKHDARYTSCRACMVRCADSPYCRRLHSPAFQCCSSCVQRRLKGIFYA